MEDTRTVTKVKETPIIDVNFKGERRQIADPQIGSIVLIKDNGFGIGFEITMTVINVAHNKEGIASSAILATVIKIEKDEVYYDENDTFAIKPYHNKGHSRWSQSSSDIVHFYYFI